MRKVIMVFIILLMVIGSGSFFLIPVPTAWAANCECANTRVGSLPHVCYDESSLSACLDHQSWWLGATLCDFNASKPFIDDKCSGNDLALISKSCQQDSDCQNISPCTGGRGKCVLNDCYVDKNLQQCWDNASAGFGQRIEFKPPTLEIRIPGVSFPSDKLQVDAQGFLTVPYLVDYIKAIYKFLVIAASIIAAIVIILNGFRITMSAGGEEKGEGIKRVGQAVIGLFIMWSSYAILYTVNPVLTQLKPIRVKYIVPEPPMTSEDENPFGDTVPTVTIASTTDATTDLNEEDKITVAQGVEVPDALAQSITDAAKTLTDPDISFLITSGYRSVEKQTALIKQHCNNPPGSATCDPKDGVQVCMLKNGPLSCPHTTGHAVDIWGSKDDGATQCLTQKQCAGNRDACRQNPCQAAVIAAMRNAGFCNLQSEPWHFENPKMSSSCN